MRSGPPRALLLEREQGLRQVLAEALEDMGFEVVASASRKQALGCLLEQPHVDLVVVDLVDANADGAAVVAFLRDVAETASIPVIVMTDGEPVDAPGAIQLAKPFDLDRLVSAVREATATARRSGGRGTEAHPDAR